jgi:ubiquinone biosynthesis protein UbiJ
MTSFTAFSPLAALFQTRTTQLACAAINHLLTSEPSIQAILKLHTQRTILLRWEANLPLPLMPAGEQTFQIDTHAHLIPHTIQATADVIITIQAGITVAPAAERLRFVQIEGDALLAQALSTVASQLRWDATHDLARVIGDAPAYWVAHYAKQAATVLQAAVTALKAHLAAHPLRPNQDK